MALFIGVSVPTLKNNINKNILIKKQYLINSINNEEKENLIIKTSKLPIVILNFSKEIIE